MGVVTEVKKLEDSTFDQNSLFNNQFSSLEEVPTLFQWLNLVRGYCSCRQVGGTLTGLGAWGHRAREGQAANPSFLETFLVLSAINIYNPIPHCKQVTEDSSISNSFLKSSWDENIIKLSLYKIEVWSLFICNKYLQKIIAVFLSRNIK